MSFRQRNTSQPNLSGHLYGITWELLTEIMKMGIGTDKDVPGEKTKDSPAMKSNELGQFCQE